VILLVTTVVRKSLRGEPSGHVRTVELDRGEVTGISPIPPPDLLDYELNERGGMRGAKGIAIAGERIFIANHSVIYGYDKSWNLIAVLTHPMCASIHDILYRDESLWVSSARNDLILQFNLKGDLLGYFNYHEEDLILSELNMNSSLLLDREAILKGKMDFRDPRTIPRNVYDRSHVNSLCFLPNGDMLVSLGRLTSRKISFLLGVKRYLKKMGLWQLFVRANTFLEHRFHMKKKDRFTDLVVVQPTYRFAILRVPVNGKASVCFQAEKTTAPNHSLLALPDGTVLFDDTTQGEIVRFDPEKKCVLSRIPIDNKFLRGIFRIAENQIVVGSQGVLYVVDFVEGRVLREIKISDDLRESIFAIAVLPPETCPLPVQLSVHQKVPSNTS